ncbi:DEAD/DEAH box helicase [Vibrio sp. NTOU-M3]|uniref:DEAD/DEAH box helicase n=1 Tax=Vibrio sp. NTOU-M3 TaxID=3234954 RepID=UPI00349FD016
MSEEKQLALKVLDYWHKIEFFNSADLGDIEQVGNGAIHYDFEEIATNPECLPWINRNQICRAGKKYTPNKHYAYKVYIGLFHRSEIFEAGRRYFPKFEQQYPDFDERRQDSGFTCSIILHVNVTGEIVLDKTEISTAPWAISKLQKNSLAAIKLSDFDKDCDKLNKRFGEICTVASNLKEECQYPSVLTTYELIEFLKALDELIQFQPVSERYIPSVMIELDERKFRKGQPTPTLPDFSFTALPDFSALGQRLDDLAKRKKKTEEKPENEEATLTHSISILNSFYIRDLELAIKHVQDGKLAPNSALAQYIGKNEDKYDDLLSAKGQTLLRKHLMLDMTPAGRWPGEDSHYMSLMQQFAINTLYRDLETQGIYSVNGPPGTGKTTMLRDIMANNLVDRARVLACLSNISQSITGYIKTKIDDKAVSVPKLNQALCGFEMVVVSSNNTAVENITKELPQTKSLGSQYQATEYFKPAAQKLAAEHKFDVPAHHRPILYPLSEDNDCWGLMAAAIGNQSNRNKVDKHLFFTATKDMDVESGAENYQKLLDTIKLLKKRTSAIQADFPSAQASFKQAEKALKDCMAELELLRSLKNRKKQLVIYQHKLESLELRCLRLKSFVTKLKSKQLSILFFLLPSFWKGRVLLNKMALRLDTCNDKYFLYKRKVEQFSRDLDRDIQACSVLFERYKDVCFDDGEADLEKDELQRRAFEHCEELNIKRANLTVKALELHEAWLIAANEKYKLGSNVLYYMSKALSNSISEREAAKIFWQWLFMFIPVVSSTFASVARQFSSFDSNEIGWLFIDEAGQASPQQAVGALFRAKRAVVVGDPLQIEPVFTIPPEFVEGFAQEQFEGDAWMTWSPTVTSVQKLADRVNPYGTYEIADNEWLGSPLRVHRRCDEPMFSISNKIAYNNKMFHGNEKPDGKPHVTWGPSQWVDITGEVDGKHYVPEQGVYVANMIYSHYLRSNELPDIYVISPFRKVKDGVKRDIERVLVEHGVAKAVVKSWLSGRVGTVHTFQGKEEKSVIFVLGVSEATKGSATWASSKPNILNVAITRAKKQVYIVGSKKVWAGLSYFCDANGLLEIKSKALVKTEDMYT